MGAHFGSLLDLLGVSEEALSHVQRLPGLITKSSLLGRPEHQQQRSQFMRQR